MTFDPSNRINNHSIPIRTRQIIVEDAKNGVPHAVLAHTHHLKVSTIDTYVRHEKKHGTVLTEYEIKKLMSKDGKVERYKVLHEPEHADFLIDRNRSIPSAPIAKYGEWFFGEYGIYVSPNTISNFFSYHKYKWKRLSPIAMEANETEQMSFKRMMEELVNDPNMLAFLDEAGRNDKTSNQTYGWGTGKVYAKISFTRGKYKISWIVLCWKNGVLTYDVYFGSVNEQRFSKFMLEKANDHLNCYPYQRSVLCVDNIGYHHCEILREMADTIGFIIAKLPTYSPLYNLAENTILDTKNQERAKGVTGAFESMISIADSLENLKHRDYSKELKEMGYMD